jgi:hypothetical protein
VTGAIGALEAAGELVRRADAGWVLLGDPPEFLRTETDGALDGTPETDGAVG